MRWGEMLDNKEQGANTIRKAVFDNYLSQEVCSGMRGEWKGRKNKKKSVYMHANERNTQVKYLALLPFATS